MSVLLETSVGDVVVDLFVKERPVASKNFLKLCKVKYYNGCEFFNVQKDFLVQSGDPEDSGRGGSSIYGLLYGDQARYFETETKPELKHLKKGTLSMAAPQPNMNASQFFITTGENLDYLDERCTVFGEVAEGMDVVMKINNAFVDTNGRPYKAIRIRHTIVLDDPFDDPAGLAVPDKSPEPTKLTDGRLEEDEAINPNEGRSQEEIEEAIAEKQARSRAEVLEILGDIPDAEVAPPENVLFVCKLNPVTQDEDLAVIFSRFGKINSVEIIRDFKTGDSLCYGFIEFDDAKAAEEAFFKMDNVLIDDRRIHVDFSQSVAKLKHLYAIRATQQKQAGGKSGGEGYTNVKQRHQRTDDKYEMVFDDAKSEHHHRSDKKRSHEDDRKRSHRRDDGDDSKRGRRHRSRTRSRSPRGDRRSRRSPSPSSRDKRRDGDDRRRRDDQRHHSSSTSHNSNRRDEGRTSVSSRDHHDRRDRKH